MIQKDSLMESVTLWFISFWTHKLQALVLRQVITAITSLQNRMTFGWGFFFLFFLQWWERKKNASSQQSFYYQISYKSLQKLHLSLPLPTEQRYPGGQLNGLAGNPEGAKRNLLCPLITSHPGVPTWWRPLETDDRLASRRLPFRGTHLVFQGAASASRQMGRRALSRLHMAASTPTHRRDKWKTWLTQRRVNGCVRV